MSRRRQKILASKMVNVVTRVVMRHYYELWEPISFFDNISTNMKQLGTQI